MDGEPGHADRMGSENWRIAATLRIAEHLEGCSEHGPLTPTCVTTSELPRSTADACIAAESFEYSNQESFEYSH